MICSVEYLYEQYDMHVRCCWSTDFVGRPRKQEVELNAVYIITELLSSPASTRFFFFFFDAFRLQGGYIDIDIDIQH